MTEGFRYQQKVYQLQGHIFTVRNELGAGWSEHIYHSALNRQLQENDIPVRSRQREELRHRGEIVHVFEPDLIVWDCIILELLDSYLSPSCQTISI